MAVAIVALKKKGARKCVLKFLKIVDVPPIRKDKNLKPSKVSR